ncbi:MAG: hypothetical protein KC435_08660 [Thermomicrobiales bacterium]|nr:hypothetical protein [Thermomicrobiales bacterium]
MSQDPQRPPTVRIDPRIIIPMVGIIAAPFIGFLFDPNIGLFILILCLAGMAWMTWNIALQAPPQQQRTLKMGAIMNAVMAVLACILFVVRL